MPTTVPEKWDELCLVSVTTQGGTAMHFGAISDEISAMDWGEKDFESKATLAGGRIINKKPMTDESFGMKLYPISAGNPQQTSATGIMQLFHPGSDTYNTSDDTTQPLVVPNTNFRRKYKVTLLWATTLPATAETIPASGVYAYRIQIFNAYLTKAKPDYGDKTFSVEATFKWAPFQKDGTRNKVEESTDDTAQLAASTSFT